MMHLSAELKTFILDIGGSKGKSNDGKLCDGGICSSCNLAFGVAARGASPSTARILPENANEKPLTAIPHRARRRTGSTSWGPGRHRFPQSRHAGRCSCLGKSHMLHLHSCTSKFLCFCMTVDGFCRFLRIMIRTPDLQPSSRQQGGCHQFEHGP